MVSQKICEHLRHSFTVDNNESVDCFALTLQEIVWNEKTNCKVTQTPKEIGGFVKEEWPFKITADRTA